MIIIKFKYILYTALTTLILFSTSVQYLEACCGGEEEKDEKKPILGKTTSGTTHSSHSVVMQQPVLQNFNNPSSSLPIPDKEGGTMTYSKNNALSTSLPEPQGRSLTASPNDSFLNDSVASIKRSSIFRQGLIEFEKQQDPILTYLAHYSFVNSFFQVQTTEKQWILTATPDDGIEMQLAITYLSQEDSESPLLAPCFSSQLKEGRSAKDIIIAPSLKGLLENNEPDLYKKLCGVFLSAHNQAHGSIFCQKGTKGYAETLFKIQDGKLLPREYHYLYVITGPTSSSNLKIKRDTFSK
ncbi:MAG: hypothetical protein JSS34_08580 [Proteobacteria bacterium]|nr:hypothetical protein [Pseudomonadota bacterium]